MEQKFSLVEVENGVKAIKCSIVTVLTDSETKRFANKKLRNRIVALAKDCHLTWSIECDNTTVLLTSRTNMVFDHQDIHDLEMATQTFLDAINKMELEDEKVQDEERERNKDVEFVKEVLQELENGDCVAFAMLAEIKFGDNGVVLPYGDISTRLAKEMCKCFIENNK